MGRAGDELPWSSVGRKELGVAESERFAVGLGVPLEPPEKVQHRPTLRSDLQMDGDGTAVGPPRVVRSHPNEPEAAHPVEEPLEGLRVHTESLPEVLVAVPRPLLHEGEEPPGLGVPEDVHQVPVRGSHHTT